MMVTFVSQCEKKSLTKTRRVLDAFANRIGSRTWQTVITREGLDAVKKLLRGSASKNTAVSCHWLRSRSRTELVWVVGNRNKFNEEGVVPVNYTEKDLLVSQWENNWRYLPLIKSLVALAGLFHDWAKASEFFQWKLGQKAKNIADPVRHEWLSVVFLEIFVGAESDEQWLGRLAQGEISSKTIIKLLTDKQKTFKNYHVLGKLPDAAALIAWLIVSHHRLPVLAWEDAKKYGDTSVSDFRLLFKELEPKWGYENQSHDFDIKLERCFEYPGGLPCDSKKWLNYAKTQAAKLNNHLDLLEQAFADGSWRLVMQHCRLALMLADHYHSSQPEPDPKWHDELNLFANTYPGTIKKKHKLVEHLVRVAKQAVHNSRLLPVFEGNRQELAQVTDVKVLQSKSSDKRFIWQDKAVAKIAAWRDEEDKGLDKRQFGFFAVNMASTGKGKTFANAKIMRALSPERQSLRYILALGLRTLTLQTGDEYRQRINLGDDEVAVLIGSKPVSDLHRAAQQSKKESEIEGLASESEQGLLDNELHFQGVVPDQHLATVLRDEKSLKFLHAPVLSCTIDHLMGATETKRSGRFILPQLRLMSSDLVIDEIDDFDGTDLIAIGRLIHLAGMLGRKVMISSATIPPDLAIGFFNVYQDGYQLFARSRQLSTRIGCGWIDEFGTKVSTMNLDSADPVADYGQAHQTFTERRLKKLQKEIVKRKGIIWPCEPQEGHDEESCRDYFNKVIWQAIQANHKLHHSCDEKSGKQVSFGLVRVANISPCVDLTRFLLELELGKDIDIRTMAYHSQQILLMRHEQERHLDQVLKRKDGFQKSFDHPVIREHLETSPAKHIIFILVATPVEEVGRDHDFDWAVVEPSSYRSFIQLAGRILRHQELDKDIQAPNIALLQYNLKGLQGKKRAFQRPGYESEMHPLNSHDLQELLAGEKIDKRLDAAPRIVKKKLLNPKTNLADLEHEVIHQLLTNYSKKGAKDMQGWLGSCWWLTGLPQVLVRFREGASQLPVFLMPEEGRYRFVEKDRFGRPVPIEEIYEIRWDEELLPRSRGRLWLYRDYETLLQALPEPDLQKAALVYGEICLPTYGAESGRPFVYASQLGLRKE